MNLLNTLLGYRRRRTQISGCVLAVGVLACLSSFLLSTVVVYLNWAGARQAAALPRPNLAELRALSPGTQVLIAASLPVNAPTGPTGLALFYTERPTDWDSESSRPTPSAQSSQWEMASPPPARMDMLLEDGTLLSIQIPQKTSFLNKQTVNLETGADETPMRHVGYLPGQALTVNSTWEGNDLLTARALYAGSITAYQTYLDSQPGNTLLAGLMCGGTGIGLLVLGIFLKVLGR